MKKSILCLGIFIALGFTAIGQKKVELKLKKGDQFEMNSSVSQVITQSMMGMDVEIILDIELAVDLRVKDINDRYIIFSQVYKSMVMNMSSPMQGISQTIDSDAPENELNKPMKSLMGKEVLVKVNMQGKVMAVTGIKELMKEVEQLAATSSNFDKFLNQEAIEKNYQLLFPVEYGKKYTAGDEWSTDSKSGSGIEVTMNTLFSATDVSRKKLKFDVLTNMNMAGTQEANGMEMEMELKGDLKGNGILNLKTGLISTYTITGIIKGTNFIEANEQIPMDMEIPMTIEQTSVTTLH